MKAALRDAKIAEAKAREGKREEAKPAKWPGFFNLFRGILGPPPEKPTPRSHTRRVRQIDRRLEAERIAKQQAHEKWCDARFRAAQLDRVIYPGGKPEGQLRRDWKPEWIEAEAYAENVRRNKRREA